MCTACRKLRNVLRKGDSAENKTGGDRFRIAALFEDEHCSEPLLEYLNTTKLGWKNREEVWEAGRDGYVYEAEEELALGELGNVFLLRQ